MNETLIVSGLGRCGTSLTMQILHAGGFPCQGRAPAFEPEETGRGMVTDEYLESLAGKAVKVLDPHLSPITTKKIKVIYLTRDTRQQAKSTVKLARTFFPDSANGESRTMIRVMEKHLRRDNRAAMRVFAGCQVLHCQFEFILQCPLGFIAAFEKFTGHKLDPRAADVVVKRGTDCLPGLLEVALIEGRE